MKIKKSILNEELNQVVHGKGLYASIKGHLCQKGTWIIQSVKWRSNSPQIASCLSTLQVQIKIFFL